MSKELSRKQINEKNSIIKYEDYAELVIDWKNKTIVCKIRLHDIPKIKQHIWQYTNRNNKPKIFYKPIGKNTNSELSIIKEICGVNSSAVIADKNKSTDNVYYYDIIDLCNLIEEGAVSK